MAKIDWEQLYPQGILIVDDSEIFVSLVKSILEHIGFTQIHCAYSGNEAISIYDDNEIKLTLLDIDMPGKDGIETLKSLRGMNSNAYVVMLTSCNPDQYIEIAKESGARAFIQKPCDPDKVNQVFEDYALQHRVYQHRK